MIRRTVLEWQHIAYGSGDCEIPEWAADRLVAVTRSSPLGGKKGARILVHGRRDLHAGQVVGVVVAEGCSLEILPKIEGLGDTTGDPSHSRVRRRLIHMLAVALGIKTGFSLLFEMDKLFQEYVARMLGRALAKDGLTVRRQGGLLYCLEELDGERCSRFQTKPDILVKHGSEVLLVIDTKWKRLSTRIKDPTYGVSEADVYQMLAYSRIYRCQHCMLLYPHHAELSDTDHFTARYRVLGSADELVIATIDVGEGEGIEARLGSLVTRQLAPLPA